MQLQTHNHLLLQNCKNVFGGAFLENKVGASEDVTKKQKLSQKRPKPAFLLSETFVISQLCIKMGLLGGAEGWTVEYKDDLATYDENIGLKLERRVAKKEISH